MKYLLIVALLALVGCGGQERETVDGLIFATANGWMHCEDGTPCNDPDRVYYQEGIYKRAVVQMPSGVYVIKSDWLDGECDTCHREEWLISSPCLPTYKMVINNAAREKGGE